MRTDIYAKGARLLREGRIRLEDESDNAVYFRVHGDTGDHLIRIGSDNRFSCTCTAASIREPRLLCSHVVGCLLALGEKVAHEHADLAEVHGAPETPRTPDAGAGERVMSEAGTVPDNEGR
ncbi:MAG: hypothetical protein ACYDDF_13230 [Thermoplasmatota archaeon]